MGHHDHHHHDHHRHHDEEQSYGAYPGSNSGYYDASSYPAQAPAYGYDASPYPAQAPAYGYGQQMGAYEGYGARQPAPYGAGAMQQYGGYESAQPSPYGGAIQSYPQNSQMQSVNQLYAQEQRHKHNEHRAEEVALGAAAFAAYEHHEVKVDPEHAGRHRLEEEIAGATAVGAAGYALYEHQEARHDDQQLQAAGYYPEHGHKHEKKHHHGLLH